MGGVRVQGWHESVGRGVRVWEERSEGVGGGVRV